MRFSCVSRLMGPTLALVWLLGAPAFPQDDDTCLVCHADASWFESDPDAMRLVVTAEQHADSLHGSMGFACVDCHADLAGFEDFPHAESLEPVDCGACHFEEQEIYAQSLHGYALERGNEKAPTCVNCHGAHDILSSSDMASPTHHDRVPELCATCHGMAGRLTDELVKTAKILDDYSHSVHGNGDGADSHRAATCVDCHGVHDLRGVGDPESRINRSNLATTCGNCHSDIETEYAASIHGRALAVGVHDSPTCTDCHGEHLILSPSDPDSKAYASHLATESCGRCHQDAALAAKYGLRGDAVSSYTDSYHGWVVRRGYESAATCVSCHTAHSVLPETHEASSIHPDNLMKTCGQCHEGINQRFAESYTHEALSVASNPINRWIRILYRGLIVVVIGGMILHNLLILGFYAIRRRQEESSEPNVLRLDRLQIVQHALMALSFIVLVLTGFALRFPEAWWVRGLTWIGMGEELRAYVHRIAGVIMMAVAIAHVLYVALVARGRREFRGMLPARSDFTEAFENLGYYGGRRERPPDFGRYDYTQKMEYWAVVWGTGLMAVTGTVLWFPGPVLKFLPAWVITASQTIHYYEAWLAFLAILVWHLFFVLFHPDEYPMNWTWLTGRMSRRLAQQRHPRWHREQSGTAGTGSPGVQEPASSSSSTLREPSAL